VLTVVGVVVVLAVVATTVLLVTRGEADAEEVLLLGASEPGPEVFTPNVAATPPPQATTPSSQRSRIGAVAGRTEIVSYPGGEPGLYGGTRDDGRCDQAQMVAFLEREPAKAQAWSSVLGIGVAEIRTYVGGLTPILLRSDTRVTNHGYANGRATSISVVLQSGTAVLVDRYGVPRVKCNCGNPLTPPTPLTKPVYRGTSWPGYSVTNVVVVQQNVTVINVFTLYDPVSGTSFGRPVGSSGAADGPAPDAAPTTSTTAPPLSSTSTVPLTLPPTVTLPPTTASTTTTSRPTTTTSAPHTSRYTTSDAVRRANGRLSNECPARWQSFETNVTESRNAEPTTDPNVFLLVVEGTTASDKTQIWRWHIDMTSGIMTPLNDLASLANQECPALNRPG
jgi:hypothetical protein